MGSKKGKDGTLSGKARRERLEFLARLAQQLDQRTDRMGLRLAELDESQAELSGLVARLRERLEHLSEQQSGAAEVLAEAMAHAREARERAAHPPGLEDLRRDLNALHSESEGVAGVLQGLTAGIEGLQRVLDEGRVRTQGLVSRLETLEQAQRGLLERERDRQTAMDDLRRELDTRGGGLAEGEVKALESRVEALERTVSEDGRGRVGALETSLASLDRLVREQGAAQDRVEALVDDCNTGMTALSSRLDALDRSVRDQVEAWRRQASQWEESQQTQATGLEILQGRVDRLDALVRETGQSLREALDGLGPLSQEVDGLRNGWNGLEEAQRSLLTRLDDLEHLGKDLKRRLEEQEGYIAEILPGELGSLQRDLSLARTGNEYQDERLDRLEAQGRGLQARIDHLVDTNQAAVNALNARLDETGRHDGVRDQGMRRLARAIADQAERTTGLQMELKENETRYQDLERRLDESSAFLEETRQRLEGQGGRLERLNGGQRILAVTAAGALLALLGVTLGTYRFEDQQRELDRRSVARELDRMEDRLSTVSGDGISPAPQVKVLERRVDALNEKAGTNDPAVAAAKRRMAELETRQKRTEAALERLRAALAHLRKQRRRAASTNVAPDEGTARSTSEARPPAAQGAGHGHRDAPSTASASAEDTWRRAQARGEFTIQLMGVRHLDGLRSLVERAGIAAQVAWYRTRLRGRPWYVALLGHYPDAQAARTALGRLPERLRSGRPWVRRLPAQVSLHAWEDARPPKE